MRLTPRHHTPYQSSVATCLTPGDVLDALRSRDLPGMSIAEQGPHHLVLEQRSRYRYGSDIATALGIAVVLAVLIATAYSPFLVILLPLALIPAAPLLLEERAQLAVSAIQEETGDTRVTAHGLVTRELGAGMDAFLDSLPPPEPLPALHASAG